MFIKSIVLDGFKSYGNRVEITGFDREFNAITGLNGTGKSNILDSICFVLGITNLSHVRAGSLQDLVYKSGQAGITKATVSITFDNRDKSQCPIGYENHDEITVTRQVVMGGKNKYLINGVNVQNKRVADLFCSVQLNVNNPHFLIMQGRITKVLNMKPPEILSMVEEAAGTRMYEAKKQMAQKTIEKKDAKLKELNDIITEEIAPKIQKLKDERAQFQEYQKVVRELENLTRLYVAWKYVSTEEGAKESAEKVNIAKTEIQEMKDTIKNNETTVKELDRKVVELNKEMEQESNRILSELQGEHQELERNEAQAQANAKHLQDNLNTHNKGQRLLQKNLKDDQAALASKKAVLNEATATFDRLRAASEQSEQALDEAQQRFLAVSGLESESGASASLQDQLMASKREASDASTRIAQTNMEKKHAEGRLKQLQQEFKSTSSQFQKDQADIAKIEGEVRKLEENLNRFAYNESEVNDLKATCKNLNMSLRTKRNNVEHLSARLQRCNFQYSDPERGFDRNRVHGTVCRLIDIADPVYCTALETAAGGRLFNVIVDTEVTSKLLLQRGNLQTRTTIIPLNKIHGSVIDNNTLRAAQEIGGGAGNVQLALSLIKFDRKLQPAMEWVFGQTLVCRDLDVAKKVCFHPRVKRRCVTIEGDVMDPSGTLSGGARPQGGSVLVNLQELKKVEEELEREEAYLRECDDKLRHAGRDFDAYQSAKQRFDLMSHELTVVRQRVETTSHHQLHQEIQSLQEKVESLTRSLEEDRAKQTEASSIAKELELKMKDLKGHREREFKKAEEELKKAKKLAEKSKSEWTQREQEFATLTLEVGELDNAVNYVLKQLSDGENTTVQLNAQLAEAKEALSQAKEAVKEVLSRIKVQKAEISGRNSSIAKLVQQKEKLKAEAAELELKIKEAEYKVTELQKEANDNAKRIRTLEVENPWIESEKRFFGEPGGAYDFNARGGGNLTGQRLQQLKERKDRLASGLNARAHTLLGKEEEQYDDVIRKKTIVEQDRAKLFQVMAELDEKKKKTLITACQQVNKDFGSIFSSLLPSAQAKLIPPEGQTVLDGLEVKVGFNGVWKESLGELSGGQRSLVALSLILAMLLFKPAPLYILDEVDAALDLSHTQNIGAMLKAHFKHSQFIIVSLKDGMFNNANVLFRTKFVDGMSTVQRSVAKSK